MIAGIEGKHGGDVEGAKQYASAASEADVDALKFQLYQAEKLIIKDKPPLPMAGEGCGSQYGRFKGLELA